MPYKNILWIKLEKRLLNDHRFFTMSERGQLFYIKILLLCAETDNQIPRKYSVLKQLLRTDCSEKQVNEVLNEIKGSFPKVIINKDFISVNEFEGRHNQVLSKDIPRISQGYPDNKTRDTADIYIDKNIYKDIEKNKNIIYSKFIFQGKPCRKDNFTGKWKALDNDEWLEVDEAFLKDIKKNV